MKFLPDADENAISYLIEKWSGSRLCLNDVGNGFAVVSGDCACTIPEGTDFVISCGLSAKATVTISSIDEEGCICCVQRGFKSLSGEMIEPQEFYVPSYGEKTECLLYAITANLIINGIFF